MEGETSVEGAGGRTVDAVTVWSACFVTGSESSSVPQNCSTRGVGEYGGRVRAYVALAARIEELRIPPCRWCPMALLITKILLWIPVTLQPS